MNDYQNPLYRRETILKHYHNPIYKNSLDKNRFPYFIASHCGDSLILNIDINDNIINKVNFDGYGCAIMIAATDIILEFIKKQNIQKVLEILETLKNYLESKVDLYNKLVKFKVFENVKVDKKRKKCITFVLNSLNQVLL